MHVVMQRGPMPVMLSSYVSVMTGCAPLTTLCMMTDRYVVATAMGLRSGRQSQAYTARQQECDKDPSNSGSHIALLAALQMRRGSARQLHEVRSIKISIQHEDHGAKARNDRTAPPSRGGSIPGFNSDST